MASGLYLTHSSVACSIPSNVLHGDSTSIAISNNGVEFSVNSAILAVTPFHSNTIEDTTMFNPQVIDVMPTRGPVVGGTLVTVVGSALDGEVWCRFGGKMGAEASVLSSSLVVCMTPAHEEGRAVLEVSGNGYDFVATDSSFSYEKVLRVHRVTPQVVSATGNATVTVYGEHFPNSKQLGCAFGSHEAEGFRLSSSIIRCGVPAEASASTSSY